MRTTKIFFGIIVMMAAVALALTLTACPTDSGGGSSDGGAKTLIIQNVPADVYMDVSTYGGLIMVVTAGTPSEDVFQGKGQVSLTQLKNGDIVITGSGSNYTITIPLYIYNNDNRWTGSGTFDIYVIRDDNTTFLFYKVSSVNISSGTTTISFNDATEVP